MRKGELEEVAMDVGATRVGIEIGGERGEFFLEPLNDRLEVIDDGEAAHEVMLKRGAGGVAETEASDDNIELGLGKGFRSGGETKAGEGLLDLGEERGHEEGVAEDDLVDFFIPKREDGAAAEDEIAKGRLAEIEFFEAWDS